jgi:hypothetical protein
MNAHTLGKGYIGKHFMHLKQTYEAVRVQKAMEFRSDKEKQGNIVKNNSLKGL